MPDPTLKIALIGTRGVPARYGGFETAVEEIGWRLVDRGHDVTVYCRGAEDPLPEYRGMHLVHLPAVRDKRLETLSHACLSAVHARSHSPGVAIVFNAANVPVLPLLQSSGIPVAVHVDGLEWQRSKWGRTGRRYYRAAEGLCVRWADALIADAEGIRSYYSRRHGTVPHLITYGAPILADVGCRRLRSIDVEPGRYHLAVARFEPENNLHLIVEGFCRSPSELPLLVVGSAPYNQPYADELQRLAGGDQRVRLLGSVWDQELLDELYGHAVTYLHGHSVGGTNPSLLRAMGAAAPVIAYDVVFNREVAGPWGRFFQDAASVAKCVVDAERDPAARRRRGFSGQHRVAERYRWDDVATQYEELCLSLAGEQRSERRQRIERSQRARRDRMPTAV